MDSRIILLVGAAGLLWLGMRSRSTTTTGGSTTPGGATTPSTTVTTGAGGQDLTVRAARGEAAAIAAADAANIRWNIDQWNYWREQAGGQPVDPSYMPVLSGSDRSAQILASEYRARLNAIGLSSIRRPVRWH